ncbi:M24 family metallopeptidase, partial [Actinomadura adrarensis]
AAEVAVAIEEATAGGGLRYGIWHGHGVGVDHDIPVITASDKTVLQPGMVISLHPNIATAGDEVGASVADTFIVTDGEPLRVSSTVQRLFHVPGSAS